MEQVILVDETDKPIGLEEKMKAHEDGKLHRAFSVFIFNDKGQLLLQRRALHKYHSGGLWTNTCCSHQREHESTLDAAHRRLQEELGFDCELTEAFNFTYKIKLDKGLTEHEFDHVVFGKYDKDPAINPDEVMEVKWVTIEALTKDIQENPSNYTYWLTYCWPTVLKQISTVLK